MLTGVDAGLKQATVLTFSHSDVRVIHVVPHGVSRVRNFSDLGPTCGNSRYSGRLYSNQQILNNSSKMLVQNVKTYRPEMVDMKSRFSEFGSEFHGLPDYNRPLNCETWGAM